MASGESMQEYLDGADAGALLLVRLRARATMLCTQLPKNNHQEAAMTKVSKDRKSNRTTPGIRDGFTPVTAKFHRQISERVRIPARPHA
jgi:hypothetical protein